LGFCRFSRTSVGVPLFHPVFFAAKNLGENNSEVSIKGIPREIRR